MHWTVRETGFCHVVTDARKLVYLTGKKMEQYDPTIKKKRTLVTCFEDMPYCIFDLSEKWKHYCWFFESHQ